MDKDEPTDLRRRQSPGMVALIHLLAPAAIVVVVLFGGGLVLGFLQALGYFFTVRGEPVGFTFFGRVLSDPDFFRSLGITLYIALTSTALASALSVLAALGLYQWGQRSRIVHFIFQIPLTVPHLVIAVAVIFMFTPAGFLARVAMRLGWISSSSQFPLLVNDRWGFGIMIAYIWKEIPFITLMLLSVLQSTGSDLLDVGKTLRAGPWQRFRYITLPMLLPSLRAASLIVFAYTFGAFEVPYLLGRTYPMMLPVWATKTTATWI